MTGRGAEDLRRRRLLDVAATGGRGAAAALESIAGREVWIRAPRLCAAGGERSDAPEFDVGVLFDVEGDLAGVVAILFTPRARDLALVSLFQEAHLAGGPAAEESAFLELGNILASQALSAIADAGHGRILLSVPQLLAKRGGADVAEPLRHGAARAEVELLDRDGELRALLVLAPAAA